MIDVSAQIPDGITMSKRFILEEIQARGGWQAFLYYKSGPFMRLIRPDKKVIELFGVAPYTTTAQAAYFADDKYATYVLLKENGIPTPTTYLCTEHDPREIEKIVTKRGKKWVVKPLDSGHGNGVSVGINSVEKLKSATAEALRFSEQVLLQEQIDAGVEIRLTVVDYNVSGASVRIPASVIGDGQHTVEELIQIENSSSQRGENYSKPLTFIDVTAAKNYLQEAIKLVPTPNQEVQVVGVSNVGRGGKLVDVSEAIPPAMVELAEKTAKISHLPVCGVDIMTKTLPTIDMSIDELDPQVIEINKSPSLYIADIARQNGERKTIKEYVDYLERL